MRKTKPMRIGELWGDFISSSPVVARKMAEARIPDLWPAIVGADLARYTVSLDLVKGILYVKMSSSVARNEIFMQREQLRNSVNKAIGIHAVNVVIVK